MKRALPTLEEAKAIAAKFCFDFDQHLRYAATLSSPQLARMHNAYREGAQDEMCDVWRFLCWSAMSTRQGESARQMADAMAAGRAAFPPRNSSRIRACREASRHLVGGIW